MVLLKIKKKSLNFPKFKSYMIYEIQKFAFKTAYVISYY